MTGQSTLLKLIMDNASRTLRSNLRAAAGRLLEARSISSNMDKCVLHMLSDSAITGDDHQYGSEENKRGLGDKASTSKKGAIGENDQSQTACKPGGSDVKNASTYGAGGSGSCFQSRMYQRAGNIVAKAWDVESVVRWFLSNKPGVTFALAMIRCASNRWKNDAMIKLLSHYVDNAELSSEYFTHAYLCVLSKAARDKLHLKVSARDWGFKSLRVEYLCSQDELDVNKHHADDGSTMYTCPVCDSILSDNGWFDH